MVNLKATFLLLPLTATWATVLSPGFPSADSTAKISVYSHIPPPGNATLPEPCALDRARTSRELNVIDYSNVKQAEFVEVTADLTPCRHAKDISMDKGGGASGLKGGASSAESTGGRGSGGEKGESGSGSYIPYQRRTPVSGEIPYRNPYQGGHHHGRPDHHGGYGSPISDAVGMTVRGSLFLFVPLSVALWLL
ncbi:hypothetical protein BJ170DRAFT_608019 [Xylariales sp. AK1849]|nr:hypothetical protein BJ170DRAFT_608019 [Xylariales sp. AK1849]